MRVGDVVIGGGAPVSVQSMTTTQTEDVPATLAQIGQLADLGCEIIRSFGTLGLQRTMNLYNNK